MSCLCLLCQLDGTLALCCLSGVVSRGAAGGLPFSSEYSDAVSVTTQKPGRAGRLEATFLCSALEDKMDISLEQA